MSNFKFTKTKIDGVIIVEQKVFGDSRGYFMETYEKRKFAEGGITAEFVQDNQSMSTKGVLRGLHFQKTHPQAKLVRVIKGAVYDVAVDLRKDNPTYGEYVGAVLSDENKKQLFIPPKFAHGFVVLSDEAEFQYKCTEFYHGDDESGIMWDDEDIAIDWPIADIDEIILSDKDKQWKTLKESQIKYE